MRRRAQLGSLFSLLLGCADELVIGDALRDASFSPDALAGSMVAERDANTPGTDPPDAALTQGPHDAGSPEPVAPQDAGLGVLVAASYALSSSVWISPLNPSGWLFGPEFVQLGFLASPGTAGGMFAAFCPTDCLIEPPDGGTASVLGERTTLMGRYTLYHVTDAGTAYGALYTEQGTNIALHFQANGIAPPSEIRVDWILADIPFTRQNNRAGP